MPCGNMQEGSTYTQLFLASVRGLRVAVIVGLVLCVNWEGVPVEVKKFMAGLLFSGV